MDTRRHDLLSAERLFNLPVSACTELLKVQHEMQALERIYAIFSEFVVRLSTHVSFNIPPPLGVAGRVVEGAVARRPIFDSAGGN